MNHIKKYWELQAQKYEDSHWASWGDNFMIALEIETISKYIKDQDSVLDIGCANGYSTFQQVKRHNLKSIVGMDYAENMIISARKILNNTDSNCSIKFDVGDILNLPYENELFDLAYTTRVLINLPTWEEQSFAIDECLRVVKKGGILVLSEGFWEPLVKLNSMRQVCNLPPLVEHDFNRYLKMSRLEKYLNNRSLNYEIQDFSSIYYLGSRLLREIATNAEEYEGYSNPINKLFYDIELKYSGGGIGIQQAFVIYK